jgi:small conductance mechanosensitive channel
VPDLTIQTDALVAWLSSNGVTLAVVAIVLLLGYRWARPRIHRTLVSLIYAQASTLGEDSARRIEIDKRVATIEDLVVKLLRALVVFAIGAVILAAFDLWGIFSGLGLILAAITLAGQAIVLDYLMGVLILAEAQYFKGDVIRVSGIEGTVEEVGLRRTVIRDTRGTVHSISNGLIRSPSNLTRSYALAVVHIDGIADADVERAIAVLDQVGQAMAADPELGERFLDVPGYTATTKLSAYGATHTRSGRVPPEHRVPIEAEMRRRVAAGLAAAGVVPIRAPGGPTPPPPNADGRPADRA